MLIRQISFPFFMYRFIQTILEIPVSGSGKCSNSENQGRSADLEAGQSHRQDVLACVRQIRW